MRLVVFAGFLISTATLAWTAAPAAPELSRRSQWVRQHWTGPKAAVPFRLRAGKRSPVWLAQKPAVRMGDAGKRTTLRWTDAGTGLRVRAEVMEYSRHAVVEWVLHIDNTLKRQSPLIEDVRALDAVLYAPAERPIVRYARGALCSPDDFEPLAAAMGPGAGLHLEPGGGRSSSEYLPFFNLALEGRPRGVIAAIGWTGEWAADFSHAPGKGTRLRAGQALTRLRLGPGESIRTPSIALLFYDGDWIRGQNLWRRFVLEHHRPQTGGKPLDPPLLAANWGSTSAAVHIANAKTLARFDIPAEYYWIDAEWYGKGVWFRNPGDWRVKPEVYPQGFRPLSDTLHASGRKFLLWFEPERVVEGTPWSSELKNWLLAVPPDKRVYRWEKQTFPSWTKSEGLRNQIVEGDRLLDLGRPEARRFLTDFIAARIAEFGLDCYRHDANIAPLEFWRAADKPGRQGMTEIRWVEGLYTFWDELRRRYPNLIIDNCASGGRRIDLETLARSTPFTRTDFVGDVAAAQSHTYGISLWVPLNATLGWIPGRDSDYTLRSGYSSALAVTPFAGGSTVQAAPPPGDFPAERVNAALRQYLNVRQYFLGDYYPLTPYSKDATAWLAWQFHREDRNEGMIQAFRRPKAAAGSLHVRLRGLDAGARYAIADADGLLDLGEHYGGDLMEEGIEITAAVKPAAVLLTYRRAAGVP
jgi:alpha-galactosidase